jgi:hypothetical protein
MSLQVGTHYVFSPSTTWAFSKRGLVTGLIVGLPRCLIMLPRETIAGARFSFGALPMLAAIEKLLADTTISPIELEEVLRRLADNNEDDALVVDLPELKALRVKNSWFSRGVYWKKPEHSGWRGLPLSGKAVGAAFEVFYRSQLRE